MNAQQLRSVLESVAAINAKGARKDVADALIAFADALKDAKKLPVAKVVDKLTDTRGRGCAMLKTPYG